MLPMAGSTPRSVFPTAMAAATVPGTPRTERAAAPRRICPKPTARACSTASQRTDMANRLMTRRRAYVVLVSTLVLASCLLLAQQTVPTAQYNTQGVTPPPGSNPTPAKMTFFVTSVGISKGGNLGGLAGADAHCQALATAVGAGGHTWHAYLSTQARPGQPAVNARDRIGPGPWYSAKGEMIASDLAHLHGDTLELARLGNNVNKLTALNEKGEIVPGLNDNPDPKDRTWAYASEHPNSNRHQMLTGSQSDGRAYADNVDHTCGNWTIGTDESLHSVRGNEGPAAQIGLSDRNGGGNGSWNSSHPTRGCSQEALPASHGVGMFYCFAMN